MAITTLLKESWDEDSAALRKSVALLKKEITVYREERKSNWKHFKLKFHRDLFKLEQSIKKAKAKNKGTAVKNKTFK
jgi:hypothetical protein